MSEIEKAQSGLRILLVRPGATDLDDQGRITGTLNIPLSDQGEQQARKTALELTGMNIDAIYCSPCLAAQQTAQFLSRDGQIRVKVEENLKNLDYGLWHGKLKEELKTTQPKLYRQWQEHPETVCPPGGETIEQAQDRIQRSIRKIRKKVRSGVVVVVAPEPLASIVRSVIDETQISEIWKIDGQFGGWESLTIPFESLA